MYIFFLYFHSLPSLSSSSANSPPAKETQKTYLALKQPPYRPPPQVFGPAWTLLYGLMGYAAYRAHSTGTNVSHSLLAGPLHPQDSLGWLPQIPTSYSRLKSPKQEHKH